MWRKLHKILILLATLTYISTAEFALECPCYETESTADAALIFLLILVAILAVDILFNITSYIRGTINGVVKDTAKKGIFSFLIDIFK